VKLGRLHEHIDLSWHELQTLCETEARFNFGVPEMLTSELNIIEMHIEAAKSSRDAETLERALLETQTLLKRLRSLLQQSQASYSKC
jgi:hypothetical protein